MKPFSSISSRNFGSLLFIARFLAVVAVLMFVVSVALGAWLLISDGAIAAASALTLSVSAASLFVFAGLVAVLISMEEQLRLQQVRGMR